MRRLQVKGAEEYEMRWYMRNTKNSAWHRVNTQHMLPIVILLSLCQVYLPTGRGYIVWYLCEWSLFISNVFFLFPVTTVFFS